MNEVWLPIKGFEDRYKVSSIGNIYSIKNDRVLANCKDKYGYCVVTLWNNGVKKQVKIHQLVCDAFLGPKPQGLTINHKNFNRSDNSLENLEYTSKRYNTLHKQNIGNIYEDGNKGFRVCFNINNEYVYIGHYESELIAKHVLHGCVKIHKVFTTTFK